MFFSCTIGPGRTRTYEVLPQLIYSQPPLPLGTRTLIYLVFRPSQQWDLNPQPIAYKAIALPIELCWHSISVVLRSQ